MVKYTLWGNNVDIGIDKEKFPTDDELSKMDDLFGNATHGYFQSPTTGLKLHYRKAIPPLTTKEPKGICVFMHGIHGCGNMGYRKSPTNKDSNGRLLGKALLMSHFSKAGYVVYIPDLEGHGFSEGNPRFYIQDWEKQVKDLDAFARFAASDAASDEGNETAIPLFLMGESYGACLALHVSRLWQDLVADPSSSTKPPQGYRGTALWSPAVVGDIPPAPVVFILRRILKPLFPTWTPFFMPHPVSADRIWKDEEVRKFYTSDREVEMRLHGGGLPFCLGTGANLLSALEQVRKKAIPGLTVPFCVSHGTEDYGVPIEGTDYLLEHSKTLEEDRAVLKKEGGYHDLLCEDDAESNLDFVLAWMDERVEIDAVFVTKGSQ